MINTLAFLVTFGQLVIIGVAYYTQMEELFLLFVAHFSPVMIFFAFLDTVITFTGQMSYWTLTGILYCLAKYFIISRAIVSDGFGMLDFMAVLFEIIYLAGTTYYVIHHSFN